MQGALPPRHPGRDAPNDVGSLLGAAPSEHRPGSGPQDPAGGGLSAAPDFHASPHLEERSGISPKATQPPGRGSVSEPGAGPGPGSPSHLPALAPQAGLSVSSTPSHCLRGLRPLPPPPPRLLPPPPPAGISTLEGSLTGSQGSPWAHTHPWLRTLAPRTSLGGAHGGGPPGGSRSPRDAQARGGSQTMERISLADGVITPHALPGPRVPGKETREPEAGRVSTPHTPGAPECSPAQPSHVAGQVGSERKDRGGSRAAHGPRPGTGPVALRH